MLHYTKIQHTNKEADTVVFIHGIGGGSNIWSRQLRAFRKHFHLVFIDLPGHGDSSYGLEDMQEASFNAITEEVVKVLEHENISSAHFVGISLGTIVIQHLNEKHPGLVKSMVLGGAVEKFNVSAKVIIGAAEVLKRFVPYMWLYKISARILMPRAHHTESRLAFVKEAYKLGKKEFLNWMKLHKQVEDTVKEAKEGTTHTPKLYIMGSEDYMFLPSVEENVDRAKNESLQVIDRCGHVCNIERHQEFNERAISFLMQHSKFIDNSQ